MGSRLGAPKAITATVRKLLWQEAGLVKNGARYVTVAAAAEGKKAKGFSLKGIGRLAAGEGSQLAMVSEPEEAA